MLRACAIPLGSQPKGTTPKMDIEPAAPQPLWQRIWNFPLVAMLAAWWLVQRLFDL